MDRDAEELKELLSRHSVRGYDVVVPFFNEATIIEQGATGPVRHVSPEAVKLGSPMVFYKVRAKNPLPFMTWATMRYGRSERGSGLMSQRYTLEAWRSQYSAALNTVPDYLMARLEAGEKLSWADVEHDSLLQRGCLDADGYVTCYTFWSNEVLIDRRQLKRGQLVQYDYKLADGERVAQGRIVGFLEDRKVALLELFTPLPYLETPDEIANDHIKRGFYSEGTYALGYGTYEAFEIAQEESGQKMIPEGKWDEERRIYTMKEMMPLSVVKDLCEASYGNEPHCLWQALIMYICPIRLEGADRKGTWRPLPEHSVESEYVVSYDFEE